MKSIFEEDAYNELLSRIEKLSPSSERQWGSMDAAQMLHHSQKPFEIPLEKTTIKKPNILMKLMIKSFKPLLYNDKPWKKNLRTAKEFVVTAPKDFDKEKQYLLDLMAEYYAERNRESWKPHPGFGHFTNAQWGQMQYKHLDHHLRQFGV
ncbi:DUF1569 domain-containing protein [Altibacter lentus]|uniref:DUF1569 domain-containing protein n=1 Tax=Altibacter lentus TaxID=1223410 RepID=UPI00054CF204|nr:DUF1569 domain-containing protein [Altibacter lentus]